MTDEQITKALACCQSNDNKTCRMCYFRQDRYCREMMAGYALNLINRQKAEIERLKEKDNRWAISYANAVARVVNAKFEAYNELAYKLKQCCSDLDTDNINEPNVRILWDAEKIIDDIVEEIMEGN